MTFKSNYFPRKFRGQWRRDHCSTRILVCFCLLFILLFQWQAKKNLRGKVKEVTDTLTVYRQMKSYSESACMNANQKRSDALLRVNDIPGNIKDGDVDTVTLIFVSKPDLGCSNSRLEELMKKYRLKSIITVFESVEIEPKELAGKSYPFLAKTMNLGGFQSYPEALENAILVARTPYFIVLNSQLDISALHPQFIEKLLKNIHGFDVIGGSEINTENEFQVSCSSLKLRNWTFFETFEYQAAGNTLRCESTSSQFFARTDSFKEVLEVSGGFERGVGPMWWKDFLLHSKNLLVVGTLPEIVLKNTASCSGIKNINNNLKKNIDALLPFVNTHHVLDFVDQNGNKVSICDGSDPLICSEKYIFPKWKLKHWAYSGLTAFPFIVQRLIDALHFGTEQLEKAGIRYALEGGTILGFVKIRAVLPWDSGDVDTFVFDSRRHIINLVKQIKREHGYEYMLRWNAFHVYVTPYYPTHDGLIVYALTRNHPAELVKIKMHGKLFPVSRDIFKFLREYYGSSYLESRIRFGDERVSCDYDGYQGCMPDCRWDGCGAGRGQFPGILS